MHRGRFPDGRIGSLPTPGPSRGRSLVADGAALPRDQAVLRWKAVEPGARYRIELSLEDLTPLAVAHALTEPEYEIPADVLARVAPGATVVWRVEARRVDGTTVTSTAFLTRVD